MTLTGSFIGADATGTSAVSNGAGAYVGGAANAHIGGTNGVTLGGPCTGNCNLISGNRFEGVYLSSGDVPNVEGNFIGTTVSGAGPLGNGIGIHGQTSNVVIGGGAPGAGNVISGNGQGINIT